ncbi:hypothetical protein CHARACLAT_013688 [Characodon lateralis]|uniref:Uncharacterized protein n=1 Tax=Characodon lateralis TaxID=208331 RepID=A0ABU7EKH9_9TELE|nr:hypothetical protein [Characodon lateralis]
MALVLRVLSAAMFASAVLLTATSAELNEMIYAVTVSSRLTAGIQETLCAHVQNPTERISLTITLTVGSTNSVILKDTVSKEYYQCINFQILASLRASLDNSGSHQQWGSVNEFSGFCYTSACCFAACRPCFILMRKPCACF